MRVNKTFEIMEEAEAKLAKRTDAQIGYILQWMGTWSELQLEDFVPTMAEKLSPERYVNGVVHSMKSLSTESRPPTLFDCQIKLLNEWWEAWDDTFREKFKSQLIESRPEIYKEIELELKGERQGEDDFFIVEVNNSKESQSETDETPEVPEAEAEKVETENLEE